MQEDFRRLKYLLNNLIYHRARVAQYSAHEAVCCIVITPTSHCLLIPRIWRLMESYKLGCGLSLDEHKQHMTQDVRVP